MAAPIPEGTASDNVQSTVRNVMKDPFRVEPMKTSLLTLTRKMRGKGNMGSTAKGPKIEFMEDTRYPRFLSVTAGTTGTAITVEDASFIQAWQLLRAGREILDVTSIDYATNIITVRRNLGNTGVVSLTVGYKLQVLPTAFPEGSPKGKTFSRALKFAYNYAQISKRGTGITRNQALTTKYHTSDEFQFQIKKNRDEIEEEVERHWLTAELPPIIIAAAGTGNAGSNYSRRIAAGLPYYVTTNRRNFFGTPSWYDFDLFMQTMMRAGDGGEFTILASQKVCTRFSQFGPEAVRTTMENETFKRNITVLSGTGGWKANIIPAYQMEGPFYGDAFWVLSMNYIADYWVSPWDIESDIQTPGDDLDEMQVFGDGCIVVGNEKAHGLGYGIN